MSAAPRATVLVTAHDAAASIGRTLRALARQEGFEAGDLEIVLVDDRSSDGTGRLAAEMGLANLRVVRLDHYEPSARTARQSAIEAGVQAARGGIVLITDSDAEPPARWARALVEAIESAEADLVGGSVRFESRGGSRVLAGLQSVDAAYYLAVCDLLGRVGLASGVLFGSAAFRRATFERLGGFARTGLRLTEDLEFARLVHSDGARVSFAPRPTVPVRACASLGELVTRAVRTSEGGPSALAAVLGGWMLLLPLLAIAAAAGASGASTALLVRWLAGVSFTALAVLRVGEPRLLPLALLYEPVAFLIGAVVAVRRARATDVEWGGIRYPLRRRAETARG